MNPGEGRGACMNNTAASAADRNRCADTIEADFGCNRMLTVPVYSDPLGRVALAALALAEGSV
jgi:hypothetical protein